LPDVADALILARAQFAFTIAIHIIFPAFSIGLASYLAFLEGAWLLTGRERPRSNCLLGLSNPGHRGGTTCDHQPE
jgi:hypothetical protein